MKYTALYKVFDLRKANKKTIFESIKGSNKEKLKKEIAAKVTPGQSYVWAIYNDDGICVYGGIAAARITETTIWRKQYIKDIAPRFFDWPPKQPSRDAHRSQRPLKKQKK